MNLLVDIGNSRLKWAVEKDGSIDGIISLDYRKPGFLADLRGQWQSMAVPENMALASVSAQSVLEAAIDLGETLWPGISLSIPRSSSNAFGVTSAYRHPEKLGIDRWLALIGAHRHYTGGICVVDCGTAITIDVLKADGRHLGGLISPGLVMMQKALASGTADLSYDEPRYQTNLATETQAGIANGVLLAAVGLIENAVRRFATPYQVILTGGDADIVAASLSVPVVTDHKLIFKGLSAFCSGNQNA